MTEQTVRMTAKDLAAEDWDKGEHSERFRKFWPDVKVFVARNWPTYVPMARTIMTAMLTDKNIPEHLKEKVYDALIEDHRRQMLAPSVKVGYSPNFTLRPDEPGVRERKIFHDQ